MSPSPLPHQGVLTRPAVATGRRPKGTSVSTRAPLRFLQIPTCYPRMRGGRHNAWEEFPVAVSRWILSRGPSTPRPGFLMGREFPWRSGRDDRLSEFSNTRDYHPRNPYLRVTKNEGGRDNVWGEFPAAVSRWSLSRGPSTPRPGFLMGQAFPWRSGRDDRT